MSGIMQLLLGGTPVVPDPYFEYTTLLLPGNGTNGAQNNTFLDSSTNAFSITRNGNTTQGTFSPFSQTGWGNYFDGTGDYLTLPNNTAFDLGTGDFTLEAWVYFNSLGGTSRNALFGSTVLGALDLQLTTPTNQISLGRNDVAYDFSSTFAFSVGRWYHVAVTRASGTARCFVDGALINSAANSVSYGQAGGSTLVGGSFSSGSPAHQINGYISNARIVKGTAVYTAAFTPSTAPLTAITNTSLLTCQSNRFIDNSSNAFAITRNGDVSVQAFSPFNPTAAWSAATYGGSGYFDGSGDYLTAPSNAAFAPGTGNFTVEAWVYPTAFSNYRAIFDTRGTITNTGMDLGLAASSAGVWGLYKGSAVTVVQSNTNLTLNTWQHVAAVRSGSTVTLYLNGVNVGSNTDAQDFSQQSCFVGTTSDNYAWQGYIASLRFVKGTAVYTSAFTPPTSPVTAITNTSLLLNFTNAGIYDATSKNDLETVGNAQISTTQSKFGGSSMYFDGVGDWLIMPTGPNLVLGTGDFTIECWLRPGSQVGSNNSFVGSNAAGGPILNLIGSGTSTSIAFNAYGSTNIFNIAYTFTQNTWVHVAVSRSGTNLRLFINGTQTGSTVTDSTNFSGFLRTVGMADNGNQIYVGYMQDLRVTKGYARYTANFTPPTAAFPLL